MSKDADVIVIGGGIIGCSVTYYLSKMGKNVLLLEREDLTRGSAGATDGVVGYHTKNPANRWIWPCRALPCSNIWARSLAWMWNMS